QTHKHTLLQTPTLHSTSFPPTSRSKPVNLFIIKMVSALAILATTLSVACTINATQVTKLVVDIAGGVDTGSCATVVGFDDAPDVELDGCAQSSSGITVPTDLGDVTVKCDVNSQGGGASQCLNQRVVCRAGCCATVNIQLSDASCTVGDICSSGSCTACAESVGINVPANLEC
ncbi:hypothetical protein BGZ63DRAFT_434725, partial [Mariannaea sp. PMI_226]